MTIANLVIRQGQWLILKKDQGSIVLTKIISMASWAALGSNSNKTGTVIEQTPVLEKSYVWFVSPVVDKTDYFFFFLKIKWHLAAFNFIFLSQIL